MEKDLKVFFPKKDFWHSISKQLRSTNLITTYKLIEYEKDLLFSRYSESSAVPVYKCPTRFNEADAAGHHKGDAGYDSTVDAATGSNSADNNTGSNSAHNAGTKEIWQPDR